jgi:hypothetical protein
MRKFLFILVGTCLLASIVVGIVSCEEVQETTQQKGEKVQESLMERAISAQPVPQVNNFLTRKAVAKWMERMDVPDKLFYIYVIADNGAKIGYFVAQYRPVSTATFLTPTQRLHDDYDWGVTMNAPSLDGTYYGSGSASSQYFFFDAETDAFIELQGLNYILMDQPLAGINVPKLRVETE